MLSITVAYGFTGTARITHTHDQKNLGRSSLNRIIQFAVF